MADSGFLEARRDKLAAIILTHGHEDHIGAIAHLWPRLKAPIYATAFTSHLVRGKLREAGLEAHADLNTVAPHKPLSFGPFQVEFVGLTHSIPEPFALAIRTDLGCVLHTGDWKIDPDPMIGDHIAEARLREIGREGVLSVIGDSTNIFEEGHSGSEAEVYDTLLDIIGQAGAGRIFVTAFASNIARMVSVARAAEQHGRRVALIGRAMLRMAEAAHATHLLGGIKPFISPQEAMRLPRDAVVFLCTGSQGESRAALRRIAEGTHPIVEIDAGDLVLFSSREIPGNEVFIYDLHNALAAAGAEIITPRRAPRLHVSGHPCREELAHMYKWLNPKSIVPVHGEYRHLKEHALFSQSLQIPNQVVATNGSIVHLAPQAVSKTGHVPHGRLYVDGRVTIPAGKNSSVRARRYLAESGLISISLALGRKGRLAAPIQLSFSGAPACDNDGQRLVELALDAAEAALAKLSPQDCAHDDVVIRKLRAAVRRRLFHHWGKKPETHIHIMRIS